MAPLLLPVVVISPLLAALVLRRGQRALAAYCLSLAGWALSVWLVLRPDTLPLGERLLMLGFFVPAAFHHAVDEQLQGDRRAAWVGYAAAALFSAVGATSPHLFLGRGGTAMGPAFLPMFAAAALMSVAPLVRVLRALPRVPEGSRERLVYLAVAGLLGAFGGGFNVLQLLAGHPSAAGLYMVLGSMVMLAWLIQSARLPSIGRFVERSLRYAVGAALLSTGWLFAVLVFVRPGDDAGTAWHSWSSALLLFLLVLLGQPLLSLARGWLAGRYFPGQGDVAGMARALADSEARAEHAGRLAEIGTLTAAVAHEVRNPLGVISAATRVLQSQGADPATLAEIREQVDRAARFADELLEYGRPAPLQLRPVDLHSTAELASGEVQRALGRVGAVQVHGEGATVQADLSQVRRMVAVLVENALLAAEHVRVRVEPTPRGARLTVDDDGPGVPPQIAPRLFEPFVSGRGRDGPRPGTGLGLAIARGVVERHGGLLRHEVAGELGGARFVVELPAEPALPAGW